MRRVLILFLTYGSEYKGALERFKEYCVSINAEKRLIIVRNDQEDLPLRQLDDTIFEMGGDNSVFEFSGWQKAVVSDAARDFDPDIYLIANDAFIVKQFYAMPVITDGVFARLSKGPAFAGNVRRFSFSTYYDGVSLSPYVSTHCSLLSRQAMDKIGTLISEPSGDKFIKPEYNINIFTEHPVWNYKLKKYIISTLTRKYHRKGIKADREHHDFFKRKIPCIMNEILLSVRVRKSGGEILDITPFPRFFSSPLTLFVFGTTVCPFQFLRKILLQLFYVFFNNRLSRAAGLEKKIEGLYAASVEKALRGGGEE